MTFDELEGKAKQLFIHTMSAILVVASIVTMHVVVHKIAELSGWSGLLWGVLPASHVFDAGHFMVLLRWLYECFQIMREE